MDAETRVDVLAESAPERIWLQVDANGDETDRSEPLKSEDWFELTWHFEPIGGQEIEYIRADIVAAAAKELTEAVEWHDEATKYLLHCEEHDAESVREAREVLSAASQRLDKATRAATSALSTIRSTL